MTTLPYAKFRVVRVCSTTRPDLGVGLPEVHGYFTEEMLVEVTPEELDFYVDDFLTRLRGEERHTEEFVLQAATSVGEPWEDIKSIKPAPGDGY